MPKGDVETYHDHGHWKNRIEGREGDVGTYKNCEDAVREGRNLARVRRVEHIIKKMDGTTGKGNSDGHNANDIKGEAGSSA